MPRKKTDAEFKLELKEKRPELEVLSFYVNNKTKIKVRDKDCGHIWEAIPHNLLQGSGCPECCLIYRTDTHEEFIEKLKKINPDIEVLSMYVKSHIKIKVRCLKCNHVWEVKPTQLIQGYGCPECYRIALTKTNEKFLEELKVIHPDIEPLEVYIGFDVGIKVQHKVCDSIWEAKPRDLLQGCGCPFCLKDSMEKPILELLKKKGIFPLHDVGLLGSNYNGSSHPLRVDFIIETVGGKLAIEADGRHHFLRTFGQTEEDLRKEQARDRYKDKLLKERGYILIRVTSSPTKEWGFKNHITLQELFDLLDVGIDKNGNVDLDVFRPYDFNRET